MQFPATIQQNKVYLTVLTVMAVIVLFASVLIAPRHSAPRTAAVVMPERAEKPHLVPVRPAASETKESVPVQGRKVGTGEASYYGKEFAGRPTANGETFNPSEMTAAHRTLPFGTKVRVTNVRNGKSIVVRINDRGPYAKNRLIDVSKGAAQKLGMIASGTARVRLEVIA